MSENVEEAWADLNQGEPSKPVAPAAPPKPVLEELERQVVDRSRALINVESYPEMPETKPRWTLQLKVIAASGSELRTYPSVTHDDLEGCLQEILGFIRERAERTSKLYKCSLDESLQSLERMQNKCAKADQLLAEILGEAR